MKISFRSALINEIRSVLLPIEAATNVSKWSETLYVREFETIFSHIKLIEIDKIPAGFIIFWIIADELHILNVAIHPDYQRRGLGRKLVSHAIEHAIEAHAGFATLEVRKNNHAAIHLYKKLGFKTLNIRRKYYADGEDARVMGLLLPIKM